MAGKKGRSGRRTRYQEVQQGNLEKICTDYLKDNFESFSPQVKQKIALTIASKAVTQKQEIKSDIEYMQKDEIADQIRRQLSAN